MNQLRTIVFVGVALLASVLPATYAGHRFSDAQRQLHASEGRFAAALQQIERIESLRAQTQRIELRARPTEDVLTIVNSLLAESGIPSQHLRSFTSEGESALEPSSRHGSAIPLRRQSMRLSLQGITTPQLGRFLNTWRRTQQIWLPTRLELVHSTSREANDRYDVAVVISAVYIAEDDRS